MSIWRRLSSIVDEHGAAALVALHEVKGSVPREAGARMIVRPDGAFHGTIGGGSLEWELLREAGRALAQGRGPARFVGQALGPDLGQCCGGWVNVLVETFDRRDAAMLEALARAEGEGTFTVVCSVGPEGRVDRSAHSFGSHSNPLPMKGDGKKWCETYGARAAPILLFGAGHVGRALALALAPLPFAVRWIDPREGAFPPHIPTNATPILTSDPEAEIVRAPADAAVIVMTHDHGLDLAITAAALQRGFPFVGLIGSATKRARFERRFRDLGIPGARIEALACPIGLPGIGGKEPAVIAASVAAQLLQERERRGASLSSPPQAGPEPLHMTTLTPDDHVHLACAVALSREHMERDAGGPFGAVIVRDGKVLAEGWNRVTSTNDPTAHAEVTAIRRACEAVQDFSLSGATLYTSCEPCPMCLASAYWARVSRIVFANTRADAAAIGFDDQLLYDEIPKPVTERLIPTIHAPSPEAKSVFAAWDAKADKIAY
jgi:xanthine dehydrogenase accessory factor